MSFAVPVRCALSRKSVGVARAAPRFRSHRSGCLRCQAEVARQRSVERHLARLERLELPAPGGFVAAVLAAMDAPERSTGQRSAVPAIAVAAGAAGAAALAAAWARHRFA